MFPASSTSGGASACLISLEEFCFGSDFFLSMLKLKVFEIRFSFEKKKEKKIERL
jgi:hypothetical protein